MAWVYILRGTSGHYYFGSTDDLERRIAGHQRGDNHTTRRFGRTIELVACRELQSIAGARKFEITLKRKKNPKLAVFMLQSPGRHGRGWATCKARCCG
jgi:predicted GIY-YIG superfamily endonuclease